MAANSSMRKVALSTDIAGSFIPASEGLENQRSAAISSVASEARRDLTRTVAAYASISGRHRTIFCRHMALTAKLREKVAGNIMTTMESLEGVSETLTAADVKLNATEVCIEHLIPRLSVAELRELHHDIRDAEETLQYVRARIDRIARAMERLEAANDDRLIQP